MLKGSLPLSRSLIRTPLLQTTQWENLLTAFRSLRVRVGISSSLPDTHTQTAQPPAIHGSLFYSPPPPSSSFSDLLILDSITFNGFLCTSICAHSTLHSLQQYINLILLLQCSSAYSQLVVSAAQRSTVQSRDSFILGFLLRFHFSLSLPSTHKCELPKCRGQTLGRIVRKEKERKKERKKKLVIFP